MAVKNTLYHGSDVIIDTPQWNSGSKRRDFGQCFYTTYSLPMARGWARKRNQVNPIVNKYAIDLELLESCDLRIKRFEANAEWARFIWSNRQDPDYIRPDYDIIIGPIADRGLSEKFALITNEGKTFEEIAPMIECTRYKTLQIGFCSERALRILNRIR